MTDTSGPAGGAPSLRDAPPYFPVEVRRAMSPSAEADGKPRLLRESDSSLKSNEDRLRLQQNSPCLLNAALDFIF